MNLRRRQLKNQEQCQASCNNTQKNRQLLSEVKALRHYVEFPSSIDGSMELSKRAGVVVAGWKTRERTIPVKRDHCFSILRLMLLLSVWSWHSNEISHQG